MSQGGPIRQDRAEMNVLFIHSELDDAELSAEEFRIYCHLSRRGSSGECFPSVASIAAVCRLNHKTVRRAVKVLVARHMITKRENPGQRTFYTLTKRSQWLGPEAALDIDTPPKMSAPNPSQNERTTPPKMSAPPLPKEAHEGNPIKVIPLRESNIAHSELFELESGKAETVTAEAVYAAYPRKVAKVEALKAIERAAKKMPFPELLRVTLLYAKTREGKDKGFTPYPASWYNAGHFLDDPKEWGHEDTQPQPQTAAGKMSAAQAI